MTLTSVSPFFRHVTALIAVLALGCSSVAPKSEVKTGDDAKGADHVVPGHGLSALPVAARVPLSETDQTSIADVAERVLPAVVNVASKRTVKQRGMEIPEQFRPFFGPGFDGSPREQLERGLGSGVIVDVGGVVVTNNHVVEGADEITVTTHDNREFDAEVVGTDKKSDLAVLRLKGNVSGLVSIPFGDSSALRLGEVVLAIGNPFGVGQTVTMGIVSAKGRANMGIVDYEDFIQTDAAINPGNSGGALVNLRGELVGVNTAILSRSGGYQGIGFSIPSMMVQPIAASLLDHGSVQRGWLGVGIQPIEADLAEALGLPQISGVLITEVAEGTPAAKAGLKQGDVVTKLGGQEVTSAGQFRNQIAARGAGEKVELEYWRDRKRGTISVKLGELPSEDEPAVAEKKAEGLSGLQLEPINEKNRAHFRIAESLQRGAVVVAVKPGSAAEEAGLRRGDVIVSVGKQAVNSPKDFSTAQAANKSGLLLVMRQGRSLYVVLKPQ